MTTINVSAKALKAAVQFAATKDPRFYLNGVLLQATADETRLVATDGGMLGAFREVRGNLVDGLVEFIIPRDVIDGLKVTEKQLKTPLIIQPSVDGHMSMTLAGTSPVLFKPVPGKFPDYPRVIPDHDYNQAVPPSQFNPALIARIDKAMRTWTGQKLMGWRLVNGKTIEDSARIECTTEGFTGVIMPIRELRDKPINWCTDRSWARYQLTAAGE